MAEVLLSPGVLARENDQSFITAQPVEAGAAIIGPTVKGPVEIPTVVTSFSEFKNTYGCIETSGSSRFSYFTSISAYNYFQQGGDSLLVSRVTAGTYTPATSSAVGSVSSSNVFTLETLSEGTICNSDGGTGSNGTLLTGSKDNLRWEIVSPNSSSGTFNLLIRRGDDTATQKIVLETWTDLSLDPMADNYISKVIGDTTQAVANEGSDYYVKTSGSYVNQSKYVRVKSVSSPMPEYLDNNGDVRSEYTTTQNFLPTASSGVFGGATGTVSSSAAGAVYENAGGADSQGLSASDYDDAISLLNNKDLYRFHTLTVPGLNKDNHSSQISSIIANAESRGDYMAIVDMKEWDKNLSTVVSEAATIDSSYAATYWPWLQTVDPDLGSQVWVPASAMMPGVYAFNDKSTAAWFAPAGLNRGGLSTVIRAERALTNGQRDSLYQGNVNPIATFPNTGVVVFGQKTLQKKASALDRVNVRRLLITMKNFISQVADNLVFEQNTTATRNSFLSAVNPYLSSIQQRQGLYAFKVVMDDSNNTPDVIDRNQLVGQIFVQPTKTAEFIYLDFTILPTGASFDGAGGGY